MVQLDSEGYFIGTVLCQESPLEPNVYLLPPDCINATVPKLKANQKAKYVGKKWIIETLPAEVIPAPIEPTYIELRAAAYPPIADYLDAVVKGDSAQLKAYKDACLAVKATYPKPTT